MDKRLKNLVILLLVYGLVFWLGFRSGEIYNRVKKGMQVEKIRIPTESSYYAVEEKDFGTYRTVDFYELGDTNVIIKFLFNENLKPLLKLRNIKIYDSKGERIY